MSSEFDITKSTEKVLREFLIREGYNPDDIAGTCEALQARGLSLRYEWFYKGAIPADKDSFTVEAIVIPWLEPEGSWATREEIYHSMKLIDKGYIL